MSMATSFFYIYAMATSFFYIYVMATSFFYIYLLATSFFYIFIDIYFDIYITFTNRRSLQSFYCHFYQDYAFNLIDRQTVWI